MEFVGKRSWRISQSVNFPIGSFGMEIMRQKAPKIKFDRKRSPGMEFVGKRSHGMEVVVKRVPGMEFVGKRSPAKVDYMHLLGDMQANDFMF